VDQFIQLVESTFAPVNRGGLSEQVLSVDISQDIFAEAQANLQVGTRSRSSS
jgi:hypothetical protein